MSTATTEYKLLAGTGIRPLSRGTEYREWRLAVIDILAEKGYWDIVSKTGSVESTDTSTKEKAAKARGLLGRLLDSNHRELYATERDPHKLWTKLESRYAGKDQARIWYLRGEVSQVKYNDEPMVDYIAKLEKLFNQLAGAGEKQAEKDKLYVLLSNLPIQYHPFRTAISSSPTFEDVKYVDVCDRLILEHQQLIGEIGKPLGGLGTTSTSGAFFSSRTTSGRGRGRGRRFGYSNKSRTGMGQDNRLGQSDRGAQRNPSRKVDKDSCLHCYEKGHWARNCPTKNSENTKGANEARGKVIRACTAATIETRHQIAGNWILDSGATHHMCGDQTHFQNFEPYNARISIANGDSIEAKGVGEILISVENGNGDVTPICLRKVLYVPGLGPNNLLSVRCIQQAGATVIFGGAGQNEVNIQMHGEDIAVAILQHNSYVLSIKPRIYDASRTYDITAGAAQLTTNSATLMEWHERLGHLGFEDVKLLAKTTESMSIKGSLENLTCDWCQLACYNPLLLG